MKTISLILTTILMMKATYEGYAQKQPQVQNISVRSPTNIKTDGKLDEWPSRDLNAYNATNRIYYVVSNNDENLYFTIRGAGNGVAKKAIAGGLVITITKATEKKSNDQIIMRFPLPQSSGNVFEIMGTVGQVASWSPAQNGKQIDSVVLISNQLLNRTVKELGIQGIKEITETTISKYNEFGIKAEMQFFKMQPIIEMSIPLKYLRVLLNNSDKLRYNIRLNEVPDQSSNVTQVTSDDGNLNHNVGFALNSTDFWGEYMLAKKPQ